MASRRSDLNTSKSQSNSTNRTCLCSPTTHPGSFRCTLHRDTPRKVSNRSKIRHVLSSSVNRSESSKMIAKANLLKVFLPQIIKPSIHNLRRRRNFQPKPTRFCLTSNGYININREGMAVS
ncbi:hypothetical protein NE237_024498 [Protea cynaroides]|uniref:Uncharacterized protein n=1 Tax=Protea cynaroides TaxID=273540 RepID=A0A9Q0H4C6_9MAGN|nr:hypothetical protein NE237_024498 [Protea cynaroides]